MIPSQVAFWLGTIGVAIGVAIHIPLYFERGIAICRAGGVSMDGMMLAGVALIIFGTLLAGIGLSPPSQVFESHASAIASMPLSTSRRSESCGPSHWGILVTLAIALVIDTMKPASIGFVLPGMIKEYGLSRSVAAALPISALTGTMLGSYLWGILADLLGRRAAILLAAIMFIGTSICGAMPTFGGNVLMCFIMGLSAGGMLPIAFTLLAETMPEKHLGWSLVLLGGVGTVGGYVAASTCAALLEPLFGWRIIWLAGLPTGLMLILLNQFIPESPEFLRLSGRSSEATRMPGRFILPPSTPSISPYQESQRAAALRENVSLIRGSFTAQTIVLNFAALTWGLVNFGIILWLPAALRARGYSVGGSDSLLAASSLLALPTTIVTAWLYDRWSKVRTLVLLYVLTAFGLAGVAALANLQPVAGSASIAVVTALMIGSNGIISVLLPYAAEHYPTRIRGRGAGLVAGSSKLGGVAAQMTSLAAIVPSLLAAAATMAVPILVSAAALSLIPQRHDGRERSNASGLGG
jgi:putative MFS transporter